MKHLLLVLVLLVLMVPTAAHGAAGTLTKVNSFGSNPGGLEMYEYVPPGLPANAPLVLFLHGCSQTAADAHKAGFSELADELGFVVVYPQQTTGNNPIRCFNWAGEYGDPANLERGKGENESIRQMVVKAIADHGLDASQVYIAGFSAGGAFVSVMLATWPELFAGAAIFSGVPYRCATTVNGAYNCQALSSHPELKKSPAEWGDLVRAAAPGHAGARPPVMIVHGTGDAIVSPDNRVELVEQWTNVHGADQTADENSMVGNHTRARYTASGKLVVESWTITSMGHAMPMGAGDPAHGCAPMGGSYIEDRGLCGAYRAVAFWGLDGPGGGDPPGTPDGGISLPGADGGPGGTLPGAPSVAIVSPQEGEVVDGAVTIEATASDDDGIARVEFYVDGVLKGSDGSAPYTQLWQTAAAGDGEHELRAVAFDAYESSSETSIVVTVGEGGAGGGAGGGDELVDPIPCACAGSGGAGGGWGGAALVVMAVLATRRRPRGGGR